MQLVARWGSPYPGGVLYVFNNIGNLQVAGTDLWAEIVMMQLWIQNNWDPAEAGQFLAEQAVLDNVPVDNSAFPNVNIHKIDGSNVHLVGQNAVNRRRSV